MAKRIPTFNLSELGGVFLKHKTYSINANDRLADEIWIFGYLEPFKLVGDDKYVNVDGTKLFIK